MSNSTRCAACKSLRRGCSQDCVLRPYFPANDPHKFDCVHKIFGSSNVTKILEQHPVDARADVAESLVFEAISRIQDPVYGCTRIIFQLQQQIIQTQYQIAKIQAEIAFQSAQQLLLQPQPQPQPQPQNHENQYQLLAGQPYWPVNASDHEQFLHLNQQKSHF